MSNFYARYVPPAKKTSNSIESAAQLNGSSKRKLPDQDLSPREPKKPRSASGDELRKDGFGVKRFVPSEKKGGNGQEAKIPTIAPAPAPARQASSAGHDVLEKYRVTDAARKNNAEAEISIRKPAQKPKLDDKAQRATEPSTEPKIKRSKKNRKEKLAVGEGVLENATSVAEFNQASHDDEDGFKKHAAVRDRFKKAQKKSEQRQHTELEEDEPDEPKPVLHGLEPLPQPVTVETPYQQPSYSTLPSWLAGADHISGDNGVAFESFGLSDVLLSNLKKQGLEKAMPIQSAVIPLLTKGSTTHKGDLAVAAATGSGKTLAYVLPMVEALKDLAVTKLRGVIVVPTRELVKQVQETFTLCAEGTKLRAATALGSKSVKDETDVLVESYDVYDPEGYNQQQSEIVDWSEFSLVELFGRVKDETRQPPDHITKYRSKVDVLICTPGRLVEHLQNTKGFSLDNVQWLVIDEVDRLLNESYQEWIEVVMPALQSRGATTVRDKVLQDMGLEVPPRVITKIILSATMTQDLSKLNSLNLRNPKLLVLDGGQKEQDAQTAIGKEDEADPIQDATGVFQLPNALIETVIMVSDGSEKPLHLLELLETRLAKNEKPATQPQTDHDSDTSSSTSSDDKSSSDSDSSSDDSSGPSSPQKSKITKTSTITSASNYAPTLIFTRSTSTAPRLARLLSLLKPSLASQTAVLTRSTASSSSSRRALRAFRLGTVSILITTDRASRGLDIPHIEHVVNYDVPASVEAYVHRVGRTARAGREGKAWTFVERREGRWFDGEIGKKGVKVGRGGKKVAKVSLSLKGGVEGEELKERYQEALKQLGEEVEG